MQAKFSVGALEGARLTASNGAHRQQQRGCFQGLLHYSPVFQPEKRKVEEIP